MKFLKKHMKESLLLTVFLVVIFICLIMFLVMWFGVSGSKYGNRLDGIKKVPLSDSYLKDITDKLKDKSIVSKATVDLEGRLVNFIIVVDKDTTKEKAEDLSKIVEENFTKKELAFYDIQVFVTTSDTKDSSIYPIIGYKHKTSKTFVWSNNE